MPDKPDDPDLFAFFTEIGIISQLSTNLLERVLPHGLTVAQFSVLNHLSRRDEPQAPAKIASAFQVSKGTMTSTLGKLQSKAFVAITPNPKDGRGKFVALTAEGLAARNASIAALGPDLAWLAEQVDAGEIAELVKQLAGIRKMLDAKRDGIE